MATVHGSSNSHSNRSILLVHGYIRETSTKLNEKMVIPGDVVSICWKHFFIRFESTIITEDKDLDSLFNLLSEKVSIDRMVNAELLYRATRDTRLDANFPYAKLKDKGPYLFIIQSTDDYIFGGYCATNIDITQRKVFLKDECAFLWVLKGRNAKKPSIYSVKPGGGDAIYFDENEYFMIFGPGGVNLLIYPPIWNKETNAIETKEKNYCMTSLSSRYDIPHGRTLVTCTNAHYDFDLEELEIYHV